MKKSTIRKSDSGRSINNKKYNKKSLYSSLIKKNKSASKGKSNGYKQFYGGKSDVMYKVPKDVKEAAKLAFKLRKLGFGGGLETGWKRANQLATKSEIAKEDVKYMKAWFARHYYTSYPSYKAWIEAKKPLNDLYWHKKHGIVAWLIWGGDPAYKWVSNITF